MRLDVQPIPCQAMPVVIVRISNDNAAFVSFVLYYNTRLFSAVL